MIVSEISAAITSTKTIADIFKGMMGLGIDTKVQAAVIDAQNEILALQAQMFDINDKFEKQAAVISELRAKLKEKQDRNLTARKYVPCTTEHGRTTVYKIQQPQTPFERTAEYCAFCFGNQKIVLLQNRYCHGCRQSV
jgi:hypothetical protein